MTDTTDAARQHPAIAPYLFYEDAVAAIEYLTRVFGFTERFPTAVDDDGRVEHAELQLGDAIVMLSSANRHEIGLFTSPEKLGGVAVGMYVHVDDVDAHHAHAKSEGADVEHEPQDQSFGARYYPVRDPEGHMWWFWSPVASKA